MNLAKTHSALLSALYFLTFYVGLSCLNAQNPQLVCDIRPNNLGSTNATTNSATLNWNDPNGAPQWELEVRPKSVAFTTGNYTANTNPFTVLGLNSATEYKFRVRSICSPGVFSNWSIVPHNFTTDITNPSSCQIKLPIVDNNCQNGFQINEIDVTTAPGSQLGVDVIVQSVQIIIGHTWDRDINLSLISPNGKVVLLTRENGGSGDNFGNPNDPNCTQTTTFTESNCNAVKITNGSAPFIGNYLPQESFTKWYDSSSPIGQWKIQVCDNAGGDFGRFELFRINFAPAQCIAPYSTNISFIEHNEAFVSWQNTGTCIDSYIEIGPKGFIPGTGPSAGSGGVVYVVPCPSTGPFKITGLTQLTDYDVYVRKSCVPGIFSPNSCVVGFTTACDVKGDLTYVESFDSQTDCSTCDCGEGGSLAGGWQNQANDDMDWLVRQGETPSGSLLTGPDGDINGSGKYLYIETSGVDCQNNKKAILQSGCYLVNSNPTDNCDFSFYSNMNGATINSLSVDLTVNGGASWSTMWSAAGQKGIDWKRSYLNLNAYQGQQIQMRIVASSGSAGSGDIAIDQLELYGSSYEGLPSKLYFTDADGDGFGDVNKTIRSCTDSAPAGFVINSLDCDDTKASIKPGGVEITCNGIDENCNGMDDDKILGSLAVIGQGTCLGASDTLIVTSSVKGNVYWFTNPTSPNPLFIGTIFITPPIAGATTYYVMDSSVTFGCRGPRVAVTINPFDVPNLATADQPKICLGQSFDLTAISVNDLKGTQGSLTYHSGSPANTLNQIINTIITPAVSTTYIILKKTPQGCKAELTVPITVNPLPGLLISPVGSPVLCPGAQFTLTATATGSGGFNYLWNNGNPSAVNTIIGSNTPGNQIYSVTVTDQNLCSAVAQKTVVSQDGITAVNINVTSVTNCFGSDGSISLIPTGIGPFKYEWKGPSNGSANNIVGGFTISSLQKGSYAVTITKIDNGCNLVLSSIVVNGPGAQLLNSSITDVSCNGLQNGSINLTIAGNNPSYLWSNSAITEDLINVSVGIYSVTITEGICDLILKNLIISEPPVLAVSGLATAPFCFGASDGNIKLFVTGGTPMYMYLWSNGLTTKDIGAIGQGTYNCTVTDQKGCKAQTALFNILAPPQLTVFVIKDEVNCFGGTDGAISITAVGGKPLYKYKWNDNITLKDRSFLPAATYRLTVTDANGCSVLTPNIQVTQPSQLNIFLQNIVPSSCKNLEDGSADMSVAGGTMPYKYLWSDNKKVEDLIGVKSGNYGLTVTDANACFQAYSNIKIPTQDSLVLFSSIISNPFCNTLQNGGVVINPVGGDGVYTYYWSNGAISKNLTAAKSGSYFVSVTDISGCALQAGPFNLVENSPVYISLNSIEIANCSGDQKGSIDISVSGQNPFTFIWSNNAITEDLKKVSAGNYSVIATDVSGCKDTLSNLILQNTGNFFGVDLAVLANISCSGDNNGKILATITGGTAPYQYNWSIGKEYDIEETQDSLLNLNSGDYTVTITDNLGCVVVDTVSLNSPSVLYLDVLDIKNSPCKFNPTGSVLVQGNGGNPPYLYYWQIQGGAVFSTNDGLIEFLDGGSYDISVIDSKGCLAMLNGAVTITAPPFDFKFSNVFVTQPDCAGGNTGAISIGLQGGIGIPTIKWEQAGLNGYTLNNLAGGVYNVTVTDQNQCSIDTSLVIVAYTPMNIQTSIVQDSVCDGNDSYIFVSISKGQMPYDIKWSNGDVTSFVDSLFPGTYAYTITDDKGCKEFASFIIGIVGMNVDNVISTSATLGMSNGTAEIFISGGSAPYTYQWDANAGFKTSSAISDLAPGFYCCLVTDQNGCKITVCVEIESVNSTTNLNQSYIRLFPNPASNLIHLSGLKETSKQVNYSIFNSLGLLVLSNRQSQYSGTFQIEIGQLPAGQYWLELVQKEQDVVRIPFVKIE